MSFPASRASRDSILIIGFKASQCLKIMNAGVPSSVDLATLQTKKETQPVLGVVSVIHCDHIKPINRWIKEGQVPAFVKGKKPNAAMRRINRIENLQWMLWRGNTQEKSGHWDDDLALEWAEYQKCFYNARNMRESNVLRREYRPLAEILKRVRKWAEARKTRKADWNPIGGPRSHTPAKIAAALSL